MTFYHVSVFADLDASVALVLNFCFQTFQLNGVNGQSSKSSWGVKRNGKNRNERAAFKLHGQESGNHRETIKERKMARAHLTRSASRSNSPLQQSLNIVPQGDQVSRLLMCGCDNSREWDVVAYLFIVWMRARRWDRQSWHWWQRDEGIMEDTTNSLLACLFFLILILFLWNRWQC